jgi:hypothetical protein
MPRARTCRDASAWSAHQARTAVVAQLSPGRRRRENGGGGRCRHRDPVVVGGSSQCVSTLPSRAVLRWRGRRDESRRRMSARP